jgi:hemoglobin-like flavoprotein
MPDVPELPPPLRPDQIALIETSFTSALRVKAELAQSVYDHLFRLEPQARNLFPPDLAIQRAKIMRALSTIVRSLGSDRELVLVAEGLARSHQRFALTDSQLHHMETAILMAFEDSLGQGFTTDMRSAWTSAFDRFIQMVCHAQDRLADVG